MDQPKLIHDFLAATLTGLGLPALCNMIQTMLMHDGYFVGYKFRYDGGYAILRVAGNTIDFYDQQGKRLKAVTRQAKERAAA